MSSKKHRKKLKRIYLKTQLEQFIALNIPSSDYALKLSEAFRDFGRAALNAMKPIIQELHR
ncbi:hypothetical protein [Elizabethkingia anophelis]|uniref:hypothetical protein n=1 Tax=Elizabethkingia anophelis TaxID=1117645 RepID=UPI002986A760|nr:hypothetical protein [Elizabethkingia anophelis]HAY3533754.1 hypothetical protein [Elizabethkingia anophelis]HAY3545870.1 hypothetical protein [Elizabethkingia anophelis]HAY3590696.1 hypothetical protein [Elizabethkingia anophelis]